MTKHKATVKRLQRELDKRAPELPFRFFTYGLPDDGLYHDKDGAYTREEVDALAESHQLIILAYGDLPPDDSSEQIQLTWDD